MRHFWTDDDLLEHFTISAEELGLLANKPSPGKLGFAVLLKFYQYEGRFPANRIEVPKTVTLYIARQLGLSPSEFYEYDWHGRTSKRYRVQIREFLGFRKWSRRYSNRLTEWLLTNVIPEQFKPEQLKEAALQHLRNLKIEPPSTITLERIINSAMSSWEDNFFKNLSAGLSLKAKKEMDLLLCGSLQEAGNQDDDPSGDSDRSSFRKLKAEPGNISLKTIIAETSKLATIQRIELPAKLFDGISQKLLKRYRDRVITEPAREVRRHPAYIRYALIAIFLHMRHREITDDLVELLICTVKRIGARAEKKVISEIIEENEAPRSRAARYQRG